MSSIAEIIYTMLNNRMAQQNPIVKNAFDMLRNGDNKGLEEMARNICNERGIDADKFRNQIKQQFGQM